MKLIVGLGNPGKKYEGTRHNLGQRVVDQLARQMVKGQWSRVKVLQSSVFRHQSLAILAKPATYVNQSGRAVKKLVGRFKVLPPNLWVVHDDVDLPLGKIKIQAGRGAAGHHGVESIVSQVGTRGFVRFRLGIGKPEKINYDQVEKFVLAKFKQGEESMVGRMVEAAVKAINLALKEGLEKARVVSSPNEKGECLKK